MALRFASGKEWQNELFFFLRLHARPSTPILAASVPSGLSAFAVPAALRQRLGFVVDFASLAYITNQDFACRNHVFNLPYRSFFSQINGTMCLLVWYYVPYQRETSCAQQFISALRKMKIPKSPKFGSKTCRRWSPRTVGKQFIFIAMSSLLSRKTGLPSERCSRMPSSTISMCFFSGRSVNCNMAQETQRSC